MKTEINIRLFEDYTFDGSKLNPEDFVKCDTISELKYEIRKAIVPVNYTQVISEKITIDPEFLKKWKELVNFVPNNVMTERLANIRKERSTYNDILPGCILNRYKTEWSWNKFDLSHYKDFPFDNSKDYKCWLDDVDHYDNTTTILLYCEEVKETVQDNMMILVPGGATEGLPAVFNDNTVIFLNEESKKFAEELAIKDAGSIRIAEDIILTC